MSNLSYFGASISQRVSASCPRFFAFYAKTSEIVKWAGVKRTAEHEGGIQRVIKPARRAAVRRFLSADTKNTLPGCIIIGFKEGSIAYTECNIENGGDLRNRCAGDLKYGQVSINFDDTLDPELDSHRMPGLIVDGQHRLKGCGDFDREDIPLLVVAIINSTSEEEAFQFIVINQKASKVQTTNIKSIIADLDTVEASLSNRLEASGIRYGESTPTLLRLNSDSDSPFFNMLDWELNDRNPAASRIISISAIETCIKQLQNSFEGLLEDRDSADAVFIDVWSTLKTLYPELWNGDEGNKFLSKVNILAISEYVTHDLLMKWAVNTVDPLEAEELKTYIVALFKPIPSIFWTSEWSIRIQDNANVRKLIQSDIETIIVNNKIGVAWNRKLKLVTA